MSKQFVADSNKYNTLEQYDEARETLKIAAQYGTDVNELMCRTGLPVTLATLQLMTKTGQQYAKPQHQIAYSCGLHERDMLTTYSPSAALSDIYYWCAAHLSTAVLFKSWGESMPVGQTYYQSVSNYLDWLSLEPVYQTEHRLYPWEIVIVKILAAAEHAARGVDGDVTILNPVLLAECDGVPHTWRTEKKRWFYDLFESKCKKMSIVLFNCQQNRLFAASSSDMYDKLDRLYEDIVDYVDRLPVNY